MFLCAPISYKLLWGFLCVLYELKRAMFSTGLSVKPIDETTLLHKNKAISCWARDKTRDRTRDKVIQ